MLKHKNLEDSSSVIESYDSKASQPNCWDELIEELTDETAATISGGFQIESGTILVGSSGSRQKDVAVDWSNNFQFEPSFVAIAEFAENRNPAWRDAFSVTILEKNRDLAVVRIQREDANAGWGQQLRLSWIAVSS